MVLWRKACESPTRSKAAIFLLFFSGDEFASEVSGSYRPTSKVVGVSTLGLRSDQVVRSLGFCEVGVKKLATAVSATESAAVDEDYEQGHRLEMLAWVFRFIGGGEMGSSTLLFREGAAGELPMMGLVDDQEQKRARPWRGLVIEVTRMNSMKSRLALLASIKSGSDVRQDLCRRVKWLQL